jgi:hypothetical protein
MGTNNSMDMGKSIDTSNRGANNRINTCNSMGTNNSMDMGKSMGASNSKGALRC